jgi:hypothetical protein
VLLSNWQEDTNPSQECNNYFVQLRAPNQGAPDAVVGMESPPPGGVFHGEASSRQERRAPASLWFAPGHSGVAGAPPSRRDATVRAKLDWRRTFRDLPLPYAVVGANDTVARQVIEALLQAGLRVPEQVAVIGITNNEHDCVTAPVPLTSVRLDGRTIGEQAARLLLRLMAGEPAPWWPVTWPRYSDVSAHPWS